LDIENNAKPRTYRIIKDLIEEQNLIDAGGGGKKTRMEKASPTKKSQECRQNRLQSKMG
jgi:hypothetical protein